MGWLACWLFCWLACWMIYLAVDRLLYR